MKMSLWIIILSLIVLGEGLEKDWDDFLIYDEDYDEDYDDTEDFNLDADLDYFFDYEEIGRLSRSLDTSNGSVQLDEDLDYTEEDEIFLDETLDYEEDADSSGDFSFQVFDPSFEEEAPIIVNHNWPVLITGGVIFVISVVAIISLLIILINKKVQENKNPQSTSGGDASETPGEIENEEV